MMLLLALNLATPVRAQWTPTSGPQGADLRGLFVQGSRLFAGTSAGIYVSSNNGATWTLANTGVAPNTTATLAAGSCDKAIKLYSVAQRSCVASLPLYEGKPEGYEQEIRLLRFAPDGNLLVAALGDGSIRFFRALPFSVTDAPENRQRL